MSDIGWLRRSGLVSTFGPGAIVDFRDGDAAVSGVVAGLEEWDRSFPPAGVAHPQSTTEPRLMQKLRQRGLEIAGFRLPPVLSDRDLETARERLVAAEFPHWHQCPRCDRVGHSDKWGRRPGSAARYCQHCTTGRDVHVVPVRFVMACERGHLQEFPWQWWVTHEPDCKDRDGFLFLKSVGAGLAGLRLSCPNCNAERNMDGVFTAETWERSKHRCAGRRPWLAGSDEPDCPETPRAIQRGATNLYFPITESSLDIPPWSDQLQSQLGQYWAPILGVENTVQRAAFVRTLAGSVLQPILQIYGWTSDRLIEEIERRLAHLRESENEDLRSAEYRQFAFGEDTPRDAANQFEIRVEAVPPELTPWFGRVVRAVRLREVRALTGFTRIHPPGGTDETRTARIAVGNPGWLPAIEVFGEGIFIDLSREQLRHWEAKPSVAARAAEIRALWADEHMARFGEEPIWLPSARFLLVHTLAHALMRQLTLDCGYSTAALRERLYVEDGERGMAGLLIYTATTDADGTLGGLQRQGTTDRLRRTVPAAIRAMEWCSSDPLCISGKMAAPEAASGAACHACVLAPETACEHFNRLLDRALLIGLPDDSDAGFIHGLLDRA
jgi:hypothetical protein